jgi:hypothetical protein
LAMTKVIARQQKINLVPTYGIKYLKEILTYL